MPERGFAPYSDVRSGTPLRQPCKTRASRRWDSIGVTRPSKIRRRNCPAPSPGPRRCVSSALNLTVPHKLLAMQLVDIVEEKARHWGAVNTIVFETRTASGVWTPVGQVAADQVTDVRSHGYNTDADAIIQSLREEFKWQDLRGASVLLLGAGGAARTAALRLAEEGVGVLHIVNRTPEKATRLLEVIAAQFPYLKPSHELPSQRVDCCSMPPPSDSRPMTRRRFPGTGCGHMGRRGSMT